MKNFLCLFLLLLLGNFLNAQNVGIGTISPAQKLEVDGAIKIGNTATNAPGTIRYQTGKFEAGDGSTWKALEGLPSKAIILAQEPDTASLKAAGFSVMRQLDIWDTSFVTVPTNFPGNWSQGFPLSTGTNPSAFNSGSETVIANNKFIFYGTDARLHAYDITTQQWSVLPGTSPLGVRSSPGVTLVGNDIFVTGGTRFVNPNFVIYNTAAKYNLTTQVWTSIANMPVPNSYHMTVAIGNDVYMLNGASSFTNGVGYNVAKKMYRYNTITNLWSADLSTASTPEYLYQGQGAARNGKILYVSSIINTNGLGVTDYDPVSQATSIVASSTGSPLAQMKGYLASIKGDKLYVIGFIDDTTNVNYNPLVSPQSYNDVVALHYVVNLSTGISTKLGVCNIEKKSIVTFQASPSSDINYAIAPSGEYFMFNTVGSQACNTILRRKGYWSYMKKN